MDIYGPQIGTVFESIILDVYDADWDGRVAIDKRTTITQPYPGHIEPHVTATRIKGTTLNGCVVRYAHCF